MNTRQEYRDVTRELLDGRAEPRIVAGLTCVAGAWAYHIDHSDREGLAWDGFSAEERGIAERAGLEILAAHNPRGLCREIAAQISNEELQPIAVAVFESACEGMLIEHVESDPVRIGHMFLQAVSARVSKNALAVG